MTKAESNLRFLFAVFLGSLALPFYILVGTNVADYITGIVAAVYRGERVCSDVGLRGIAKKVCMWLLVLIGFVLDYLIVQMGHTMHIEISADCIVAVAVVFWLLLLQNRQKCIPLHHISIVQGDICFFLSGCR